MTATARLSRRVTAVLAPNPGVMTGPGTNTYVIGSPPCAVIDPAADDPGYLDEIIDAAGEVGLILVTHRHPDHIGGVAALAERTGALVAAHGPDLADGVGVRPIADSETVEVGGVGLKAMHTPGHAPDHLCFLIEGTQELIVGDNVLGRGTAVIAPPDGNMTDYLDSLRRMLQAVPERLYPGHFEPIEDARAAVEGYIAHRLDREAKILAAVASGEGSLDRIVAAAYDDTPTELHPIARGSALAHLEKLAREGRLRLDGGTWNTA